MFCMQCGSLLAEDARFCPRCGAAAEEETVQVPVPAAQVPVQTVPAQVPVQGAAQQGGRRMLLLVLAAVVLVGGYFYYKKNLSPEAKIDAAMQRFTVSVSRCDLNGAMGCFDPAYSTLVQGAMGALSGYVGVDLQEVLYDILDTVGDYGWDHGYSQGIPPVSYQIHNIQLYDSSHADVSVTLTLGVGPDAEPASKVLGMVKKDGNWYFTGKGFFW